MCCNSVEELRVSHDWLHVLNVFKHCSMMLSIPEDQISSFLFSVLLGLRILLPGHLSILLCHIISMEKFSVDMVYSETSHLVRLLSTMVPRLFAIDCLQAIHYKSICKWYRSGTLLTNHIDFFLHVLSM